MSSGTIRCVTFQVNVFDVNWSLFHIIPSLFQISTIDTAVRAVIEDKDQVRSPRL